MWIERTHWSENFLTFARQYPKGTLNIKMLIATIIKFIKPLLFESRT